MDWKLHNLQTTNKSIIIGEKNEKVNRHISVSANS